MFYRILLIAAILSVFATSLLARKRLDVPLRPEVAPRWQCRRIVSMAPSITETLNALGLGDRVVGIVEGVKGDSPIFAARKSGQSPSCLKIGTLPEYPPEVKDEARIGSLFDPNFEAILALKPDLVIALEEQSPSVETLSRLKVETLVVNHKSIEGVVESFRTIGRVCGKGPEGRRMEKDNASFPDPRFIRLVEDLARTLHPELGAARGGQSHFRGENDSRPGNVPRAAKIGTVPCVPEGGGK